MKEKQNSNKSIIELDLNQHLKSILHTKETDHLHKLKTEDSKFYTDKEIQLNKRHTQIESENYLSLKNFNQLREHALSKGGFLSTELRHDFWLKILSLNKNIREEESYLYIDNKLRNFKGHNIFLSSMQLNNKSKVRSIIKY